MVLIKAVAEDGEEIGLVNWFGVHGTSLSQDNHLVHGDNKGWAAFRFDQGGRSEEPFVAAFGQSACGDVSPNQPDPSDPVGKFLRPSDLDPTLTEYDNPRVHGALQYEAAKRLYDAASERVRGGLHYRHSYVDYQNISIDPVYSGVTGAMTCIAAIGGGFVAGTEEGSPAILGDSKEGSITYGGVKLNPIVSSEVQECQGVKQVVLQVGDVSEWWIDDTPWVETDVPIQIFTIGQVAIVGSTFEITTMAARRIRERLLATLAPIGVTEVVIAAIANGYNHYMTTREEYEKQHFEGAFTHFGPWTHAAFIQETDRLARALVEGKPARSGAEPVDLSGEQLVHTQIDSTGVVNDAPGAGAYGDVVTQPNSTYDAGQGSVEVTFRSGHPRNVADLTQSGQLGTFFSANVFSYLEIQRQEGGAWTTIATDTGPLTRFRWTRTGGSLSPTSEVTVTWDLREAEPGTYRILHRGIAKETLLGLSPDYVPYTGTSEAFVVR